MREGDFPHKVRNSNIMAVTVDLPLVPAHGNCLPRGDERGEKVGAMHDRKTKGAG